MKKTQSPISSEPLDSPIHILPTVVIVSPLEGENVGLTANVRGFGDIDDPSLLQLLVQSVLNGRWYLQGDIAFKGNIWNSDCQFGDPAHPGNEYRIVAVYGSPLSLKYYDKIPNGLIQSNIVTVRRTE